MLAKKVSQGIRRAGMTGGIPELKFESETPTTEWAGMTNGVEIGRKV